MDFQITQISDSGSGSAVRDRLITERMLAMQGDCYSSTFTRTVQSTFFEVFDTVREALSWVDVEVRSFDSRSAVITLKGSQTFFTLYAGHNHASMDAWERRERLVRLEGYGDRDLLHQVHTRMQELLPETKYASLTWEFSTMQGRQQRNLTLGAGKPARSAFYPFLQPDVHAYQSRYLESDSSVLICLGPPGGGKTSFIRDMIHAHSLKTTFTYDEQLLDSDDLFVDFISGDQDLLVVEDADTFLTDRARGDNQKMARFLNVSDGLAAPAHSKKLIFTANISNKQQIDAALLRPGRCFDCQVFRPLTFTEACAAAEAAELAPCLVEDRSYTLAEIFALSRGERMVEAPNKMGVIR